MVLNLWFFVSTSVFKLKSLLQLNFIGWGVGKFRRCTVVSSLNINIQSDYSFVFRWNCFSRYARCRCHEHVNLHPPVHLFTNTSGFSAHLLIIVKAFPFVLIMRKQGLYEEWAGQGIVPLDLGFFHWDFFSVKKKNR